MLCCMVLRWSAPLYPVFPAFSHTAQSPAQLRCSTMPPYATQYPSQMIGLFLITVRTPGQTPSFISLYFTSSILTPDCSNTRAVLYPHGQNAMLYIRPCAHRPRPLALSQPPHTPQSLYLPIIHLQDHLEFTGSLR
jgi:hypothetical protein